MTLINIQLTRTWNKPQQYIVQHLLFDSIKEIKKKKNGVELKLVNEKTSFRLSLEIDKSFIRKIHEKR